MTFRTRRTRASNRAARIFRDFSPNPTGIGPSSGPLTWRDKACMRVGALPGPQEHAGQGDTRPPRSYHTRPLRPPQSRLPEVRQSRAAQCHSRPPGLHPRLQFPGPTIDADDEFGCWRVTFSQRSPSFPDSGRSAADGNSPPVSVLGQGPNRRDRAVVAAPRANYDHDQYRRPTLP